MLVLATLFNSISLVLKILSKFHSKVYYNGVCMVSFTRIDFFFNIVVLNQKNSVLNFLKLLVLDIYCTKQGSVQSLLHFIH